MPSDANFVRTLSAEELGVPLPTSETTAAMPDAEAPVSANDDHFVLTIQRLLNQFGGVILTGPPGTSKSWWATQIAESLTDDEADRAFVQFHASYQYEDFIYGYVPDPEVELGGGFMGRKAVFLQACERAEAIAPKPYVLVIDEFSRADVGRVFGEALTYIEDTKRDKSFTIAAGIEVSVPKNLLILATMNPFDRGVDEVDAAFERRFAKVSMEPDSEWLEQRLAGGELDTDVARKVVSWFRAINGHKDNRLAAVGHAYFKGVTDINSLREVWEYQLKYHVERAFRLDSDGLAAVESGWRKIFEGVSGGWDGETFPEAPSVSTLPEQS